MVFRNLEIFLLIILVLFFLLVKIVWLGKFFIIIFFMISVFFLWKLLKKVLIRCLVFILEKEFWENVIVEIKMKVVVIKNFII